MRVRPFVPVVLYAFLGSSAGLALWAQSNPGAVPVLLAQVAPWLFLVFAVGFAVYRLALVTARKYSPFKAFFQVAVSAVFFLLLLPTFGRVTQRASVNDIPSLLKDANPRVRILAAEVARHRPEGPSLVPALVEAMDDAEPAVRRAAYESARALTGKDLGSPEDPAARQAWKDAAP